MSGVIAWACTDGQGVTGGALPVALDLVPSFQVDPTLYNTPPIDNIRIRATASLTGDEVGSMDQSVDPDEPEWSLSLSVETEGEELDVIVEIELLSDGGVIWSGRAGPFTVEPGATSAAQVVDVFRGPLDNLDVVDVVIVDPPTQILVSESEILSVDVTLEEQSTAVPIVFWASGAPGAATVVPSGGPNPTLTGVGVGTVEIFAGAGRESDQFTLEVLPRVSAVVVTPDPVTVDGVGATTQFTAAVSDGFGNPDQTAAVTWTSSDESVATVDATGLVTSVGFGTVEVQATSFGVTGSADLTVRGPDLVPASAGVVLDGQGEIVDLADVEFQIDIQNVGPVGAGASTLQVLVLDGVTLLEAHPPLDFAIPALAQNEVFSVVEIGGQQIQPVTLPATLVFEVRVDGLDEVPETNEANNIGLAGPFDVAGPASGVRTWVGGSTDSPSAWGFPANWSPASVPTADDRVVIPPTANDPILGASQEVATLFVQVGATLDGAGRTLAVAGDLVSEGDVVNASIEVVGPGAELRGNLDVLVVSAPRDPSGDLTLSGGLTLAEPFGVGANTVDIGGSLTLRTNGLLVMTEAAGVVVVVGDVTFSGADHAGSLTAGVLAVDGNFASTGAGFAASDAHITVFRGAAGQDVTFEQPGAALGRFAILTLGSTAGTTLASDVFALGQVNVQETLIVPTTRTLDIGGAIFLEPGSTLDVDGVVTATGGCTDFGGTITGSGTHPCAPGAFSKVWVGGSVDGPTEWGNQANWAPVGAPTGTDDVLVDVATNQPVLLGDASVGDLTVGDQSTVDLGGFTLTVLGDLDAGQTITNGTVNAAGGGTIRGDVDALVIAAPYTASGPLNVSGDMTVSQNFDLGGQDATVGGDLLVQGPTARVVMTAADASLDVTGSATFDGASHSGWLSEGTLLLRGDFVVTGANALGFVGSLNHTVVLAGSAPTSVDFATPGTTLQRVHNLEFQSTAPVTLVTDLFASGIIDVTPGSQIFDGGDISVWIAGGLIDDDAAMLPVSIHLYGDVSVLPPAIGRPLIIESPLVLPNSTAVTGSVTANATLTLGANTLAVSGDFAATGGGTQLRMLDAASILDVEGDVLIDGGSTSGWLTDGEVRVGGDFTALATSTSLSFVGALAHEVIFDGGGPQAISFSSPGGGTQRFQNLTFATGTTTTLATDMTVSATLDVQGTATVDASDDVVSVAGAYVDPTNGMTVAQLNTTGDLTAIPAALTTNLFVNAALNLPNSVAITGDVTVNATLIFGANTLAVSGDFTAAGGGTQLRMLDVASILDVEGDVLIDGGSTSGWLTDGELRVGGDFTALATSTSLSFVGSLAHEVIFDGAGPQAISFSSPGASTQRFMNLTFATGTTTTLATAMTVSATLDVQGTATVDASDDVVSVAGAYVDPANGMTVAQLNTTGDLTAIPAALTTDLFVNAPLNLPNSTAITGDVTVNATLIFGANTLAVSGDFTTAGGGTQLRMLDVASILDVEGDVLIDGGSTSGWLTDGELRVGGDFTALATSTSLSFVGSLAHEVIFDGAGPQAISFSSPGASTQRFMNLTFATGTTTTLATAMTVSATLDVQGTATVDASDDVVSVAGAYVDPTNGMTVAQLNTTGDLTAIPAALTTNLFVNAPLNLPNSVAITGDVAVNATLIFGANTLAVSGDFAATGGGTQLRMLDAASILDVEGDVLIDGGSTSGWLTDGELQVGGDFTALATSSALSFVGSGAHEVIFDGVSPQTITMSSPGTGTQRFQNLTNENFPAAVTLAGTVVVMDTLTADDVEFGSAGPVGTLLDVRGVLNVNETSFTGLPLSLITTSSPALHTLDLVTFSGMDPTEIQLFLRMPGGGTLNSSDMTFLTTPTTGAFLRIESSNATEWVLEMNNPTPGGLTTGQAEDDGVARYVWPWP